jgi:hypothetical protein
MLQAQTFYMKRLLHTSVTVVNDKQAGQTVPGNTKKNTHVELIQ